jgi:hypothetical protein
VLTLELLPAEGTFPITQAMVNEWTSTFPGVDVMAELRKACQWAVDNPTRRKTKRGARKYLGGWLSRAPDRSRAAAGSGPQQRQIGWHPGSRPEEFSTGDVKL